MAGGGSGVVSVLKLPVPSSNVTSVPKKVTRIAKP